MKKQSLQATAILIVLMSSFARAALHYEPDVCPNSMAKETIRSNSSTFHLNLKNSNLDPLEKKLTVLFLDLGSTLR